VKEIFRNDKAFRARENCKIGTSAAKATAEKLTRHSERSEESLFDLTSGKKEREILRSAQSDRVKHFFAAFNAVTPCITNVVAKATTQQCSSSLPDFSGGSGCAFNLANV
jgi:hypothetical protein